MLQTDIEAENDPIEPGGLDLRSSSALPAQVSTVRSAAIDGIKK
jgi:hypothetical protein